MGGNHRGPGLSILAGQSYLGPQALECAPEANFQSQYTHQIFIVRNCQLLCQQVCLTRGVEGILLAQDYGARPCA